MTTNNPLISVVIPVYNGECYLEKCLDSLLVQTYSFFELILINDGSNDGSAQICNEYTRKDRRIKVYHQENAGVSVSRNRGIEQAAGEYLSFVDADDWVGNNYLRNLLNGLSLESDKAMVIGGLTQVHTNGYVEKISFTDKELRGREIISAYSDIGIYKYGYSASKLYSLSLIREMNLRFNEKVHHAEDLLFMMDYLRGVDFIRFSSSNDYYYIHHDGISLSRSNRSFKMEITVYRRMMEHFRDLESLYGGSKNQFDKMCDDISIYLIRALPALYRPPYVMKRKERLRAIRTLGKTDFIILQRNYHPCRLTDKIGKTMLLNHFIKLYDVYMNLLFGIRYRVVAKFRK